MPEFAEDIGSIKYNVETGEYDIERGPTKQGFVFKSVKNYKLHDNEPCYVPELYDSIYSRKHFLLLGNEQEDVADLLFEQVDWQSPETLLDELLNERELVECPHCGKYVIYGAGSNNVSACPYCGAPICVDND